MLVKAVRSFSERYRDVKTTYNMHDAHFRLNCLLAMLVRLQPLIVGGMMDFRGIDLVRFETDLIYAIRYAVSELCCYFKPLCKYSLFWYCPNLPCVLRWCVIGRLPWSSFVAAISEIVF